MIHQDHDYQKNLQVMNENEKDDEWNVKYEMTCRKTRMNMGTD